MPRTGRVQEWGGPSGQHPEQIRQGQLPEPGSQSLTGMSEHTGPRCWLDGCHLLDKDAPVDMTGTFSASLDPELMLFRAHGTVHWAHSHRLTTFGIYLHTPIRVIGMRTFG